MTVSRLSTPPRFASSALTEGLCDGVHCHSTEAVGGPFHKTFPHPCYRLNLSAHRWRGVTSGGALKKESTMPNTSLVPHRAGINTFTPPCSSEPAERNHQRKGQHCWPVDHSSKPAPVPHERFVEQPVQASLSATVTLRSCSRAAVRLRQLRTHFHLRLRAAAGIVTVAPTDPRRPHFLPHIWGISATQGHLAETDRLGAHT